MSKKTLYTNLLGSLVKKGKKIKASSLLKQALGTVSSNLNLKPNVVIYNLSKKLNHLIELKKVKVRKNTHIVPFPVTLSRRRFLFSKQLLSSFDSKLVKKKVTTSEKLSEQMMSFLEKRGSNFNKKDDYLKQVIANRSNAHYRW